MIGHWKLIRPRNKKKKNEESGISLQVTIEWINILITGVSVKEDRETGRKLIWGNDGYKLPKSEEENRHPNLRTIISSN